MGGKGSGRPPSTETLIARSSTPKYNPIATDMFIPNLSGDLSRGSVRATPTQDLNPVNKKYVDDAIASAGYKIYIEEGDVAKANNSAADLYLDLNTDDFSTSVVGNEVNISVDTSNWTKDIIPDSNLGRNLGSSSPIRYWSALYCNVLALNSLAYFTGNTSGVITAIGNMDLSGVIAIGSAATVDTTKSASIYHTFTGTGSTGQIGIFSTPTFSPASSNTADQIAIGGYAAPTSSNWGAGSRFGGLSFGVFGAAFGTSGSSNTDWIGTASFGMASYSGTMNAKDVYGLKAVSFDNNTQVLMGGLCQSSKITATNCYGVYIYDIYALGSGGSVTNSYGLVVENQTKGGTINCAAWIKGDVMLREMSAPATPPATNCRIYCIDDGDNTTSLYVKFDDGTAVRLAGN